MGSKVVRMKSGEVFIKMIIKSRRLRWGEHVVRIDEIRSTFGILKGRPIGKKPPGRPRCK